MERSGPACAHAPAAPPAGDAPGPVQVALRAGAIRLPDLPVELLVAIVAELLEDDELATSLVCRRLREAVAATMRRAAGARLSTSIGSVFGSMRQLEWAVSSCGLPLSGGLLVRAAQSGQLEQLSWLCARGCP
jgi:hypothetical protein